VLHSICSIVYENDRIGGEIEKSWENNRDKLGEGGAEISTVFRTYVEVVIPTLLTLLRVIIIWQPVSTSSRSHLQGIVQELECIQKLSTMR